MNILKLGIVIVAVTLFGQAYATWDLAPHKIQTSEIVPVLGSGDTQLSNSLFYYNEVRKGSEIYVLDKESEKYINLNPNKTVSLADATAPGSGYKPLGSAKVPTDAGHNVPLKIEKNGEEYQYISDGYIHLNPMKTLDMHVGQDKAAQAKWLEGRL